VGEFLLGEINVWDTTGVGDATTTRQQQHATASFQETDIRTNEQTNRQMDIATALLKALALTAVA